MCIALKLTGIFGNSSAYIYQSYVLCVWLAITFPHDWWLDVIIKKFPHHHKHHLRPAISAALSYFPKDDSRLIDLILLRLFLIDWFAIDSITIGIIWATNLRPSGFHSMLWVIFPVLCLRWWGESSSLKNDPQVIFFILGCVQTEAPTFFNFIWAGNFHHLKTMWFFRELTEHESPFSFLSTNLPAQEWLIFLRSWLLTLTSHADWCK